MTDRIRYEVSKIKHFTFHPLDIRKEKSQDIMKGFEEEVK